MTLNTLSRRRVLQGLAAAALPLGPFGCAEKKPNALVVGGLPVTCNLTLPVACVAKADRQQHRRPPARRSIEFEYSKYNGWPEIKESLMAGRIQAGYMLAPLVMDLADKGIPGEDRVARASLGRGHHGAHRVAVSALPAARRQAHRDSRAASPWTSCSCAACSRRKDMRVEELEIVEMPPPDMPAALYANAVDAYCTGEPFGAAAQSAGYARPLRMTRDEWPKYICCVLTVREELIAENPAMVQDLVNQVLGAGTWLDQQPANREKAVQIAAGPAVLQPGPEDHPLRDAEPDRPGHLRRPAHDPHGVRGADAAVDGGRHDQASDPVREVRGRAVRAQRAARRRFRCEQLR